MQFLLRFSLHLCPCSQQYMTHSYPSSKMCNKVFLTMLYSTCRRSSAHVLYIFVGRGERKKSPPPSTREKARQPQPLISGSLPLPSPPPIPQLPITERKKTNFQRRYLSQSSHPAARRKATEPTFLCSLRRFGRKNWWWKEGGSGFSFSPLFFWRRREGGKGGVLR